MRRMVTLLAAAVVLGSAAVGAHTVQAQQAPPVSCSPAVTSATTAPDPLVAANNRFGFQLLADLLAHEQAPNIFISPTSAALALEMTYDGARGSTERAMAHALGIDALGQDAVRTQAASLLAHLRDTDPNMRLDIADSLWARQGELFNLDFLAHAQQFYGAHVTTLDFNAPTTVPTINSWVACATENTIPSVLKRITPKQVLFLINAVYFHGAWTTGFNPANTIVGSFFTAEGTAMPEHFMRGRAAFPYYASPDVRILSLPYGNGRFNLVIVLPWSNRRLADLLPAVRDNWSSWMARLTPRTVNVIMPRFHLDGAYRLNDPLKRLGMAAAFERRHADFSGMSTMPRVYISYVLQKTHLAIDETGTTASAATVVAMKLFDQDDSDMLVDHPFFLAIRDSTTGAILFLGVISKPGSS
jgi:serine protease inhibitor